MKQTFPKNTGVLIVVSNASLWTNLIKKIIIKKNVFLIEMESVEAAIFNVQ